MTMNSHHKPKVFLFGPQALALDVSFFRQLSLHLHADPHGKWALSTVSELPQLWETLISSIPKLQHFSGAQLLQDLDQGLQTGDISPSLFPLPNTLLSPLVVIAQLTQYVDLITAALPNLGENDKFPASITESSETLGLCTGILSAFAVSSSSNLAELYKNGAVAVRLAMLAGALVDAEQASPDSNGVATSVSVSWNGAETKASLYGVLEKCPAAYISVYVDEKRSTVTLPQQEAADLIQQMKSLGLHVSEVPLSGRFHWPGHAEEAEQLIALCKSHDILQFPESSKIILPSVLASGASLHEIALREILIRPSHWLETFTSVYTTHVEVGGATFICLGPERCVPPTMTRKLGTQLVQVSEIDPAASSLPAQLVGQHMDDLPDDRVAVIGMACLVPGADDLEGYWSILSRGQSQHTEVPLERFSMQTPFRELDPSRKWYGNFIADYDAFDHKFFKKSPRESASADPQHRLIMQLAYQAVEQSGYFSASKKQGDEHIGCYIGIGNVDYDRNIACYPGNAYSATGNLRSFVAGKVSHYFGWTGPSVTVDTACSSSGVAVHQACRAILHGECTTALAGGVNVLTNPDWFHNLAGASFLSPTGQCKPFDAAADGYCRGEGAGVVYLKKLSSAIADGDQVLGVISSTRVYQNRNCTAITVPNTESLSELFGDIVQQARLPPHAITVVEAHGTGTPVGDPAEYAAIKETLGGSIRSDVLSLMSVKGLLGHTEFASGIISLVKILLMMQEGSIPPQASFNSINPALHAVREDMIDIPTKLRPWNADFRAALINNYGASGSNASIVVTQAPKRSSNDSKTSLVSADGVKFPFWFTAHDSQSLRAYIVKFRDFLRRHSSSTKNLSACNVSFQLARQSNRTLPKALQLTASSATDLDQNLLAFQKGELAETELPPPRPVILCFGGQISTFVGLSEEVYHQVAGLKAHLDECDAVGQSLGLGSIYPGIFQRSPIEDTVLLQTILFAMQYSCARLWIESGVQVATVVGHSFGELTALCIAQVYSLRDALRIVSGRARLVRDSWGTEKGSMLAVEADLADVQSLISESQKASGGLSDVSIACYNGPRLFTLAGSSQFIELTQDLAKSSPVFASIKAKRLNVSNAFHSSLVDPLIPDLETLGQAITFHESTIRIEHATESRTTGRPAGNFFSQHLRNPVFFDHAVQRLAKEFPSAIWLEAGSNSTVTTMASRALGKATSAHHFQSVNITGDSSSLQSLVETTVKLWKEGLNVTFWGHHARQIDDYTPVILPPYQFEKSRHWMELKEPPKVEVPVVQSSQHSDVPKGLTTLLTYQDPSKQSARFQVNTEIDKFQRPASANLVAGTAAVAPGILHLQIALDALMSLQPDFSNFKYEPEVRDISYHSALLASHSGDVYLDVACKDDKGLTWNWWLRSNHSEFSSGTAEFRPASDPRLIADYESLSRLSGRKSCAGLLHGGQAEEVLQGRNIYRAFEQVVKYGELFRCATKIAGRDNESAAQVTKAYQGEAWIDHVLTECFCQAAGISVNLMNDSSDLNERGIFVCDGISRWTRKPRLGATGSLPDNWEVFAVHHQESASKYVSDVFAFDPRDGSLIEAILGVSYQKIPMDTLRSVLSRGAEPRHASSAPPAVAVPLPPVNSSPHPTKDYSTSAPSITPVNGSIKAKVAKPPREDFTAKTREIICNLSGLEPDEIQDDSDLIELGIDSLMAMELVSEVKAAFKCTLQNEQLMELTDFKSLVVCIQSVLGFEDVDDADEEPTEVIPETNGTNGAVHTNGVNGANGVNKVNGTNGINGNGLHTNGGNTHASFTTATVRETFSQIKWATDDAIVRGQLANYYKEVMPRSTELCIVYILDAFEKLGCPIRSAAPGQRLERIPYDPKHAQFIDLIYGLLETDARLIDIKDGEIIRTAVAAPTSSAETLLAKLLHDEPVHAAEHKLTAIVGARFVKLITGEEDGVQLIFGTSEAREVASQMYAKSPINTAWIQQLADFLHQLLDRLPRTGEPICILEIGAGTGGTTSKIVPLLAALGVPVKYTMSDISGSLVAAARKRFKQYPFMEFKVVNMETEPDAKFFESQHIILATNCVHATRNLSISLKNLHRMLRPEGFLVMLEMTEQVPWVDFIFGFLEGWWLFEDGRNYVLQPASYWEQVLQSTGYGHVDWTAGDLPEANIQRLIIAHASGPRYEHAPKPALPSIVEPQLTFDNPEREAMIEAYVTKYTADFIPPSPTNAAPHNASASTEQCVLVTGATGSLGSHVVAYLAHRPDITRIICLNRLSTVDANERQRASLEKRGITLDAAPLSKLHVLETDTSKPNLGLSPETYTHLTHTVTHIVHSAWPMSLTRPIRTYETQFKTARNLLTLASDIIARRPAPFKLGFEFVSSSAVIANYPLWTGSPLVPEKPGTIASLPGTGYAEAKLVVERMLARTLYQYPESFHALVVRVAQIAGSTSNGYWNPTEYMPFLIKSSQVLRLLPDLDGTLSWYPVNDVAATLGELLLTETSTDLIYHIDNPSRQDWKDMISTLARALGIPQEGIVPFQTWVDRVRRFRGSVSDNPALQLIEFFDHYFVPMSCGGLVLDTDKATKHSQTLRQSGRIDEEQILKYIVRWKQEGFLNA
ncbi:putative polyketide synthase [Aspergillus clavatus NRRL 1]|uniref:Polyketide synthase, putative n=1 Tax=Aspergillus clavatus (strain ATCC 1007 / CBS 513.65 / DSM 816 / NCTC 3887 / NRRL 1 / QM 1276 / 107) TaxID=344612 RepID=A1CDX2_ASPCL|nr:polyketide synthase, putative [Aspergillus clavatus NRRL 1]EAW12049.1 polyketide synthase, putative [Aspergillus clavatus NRRL 1]